MMDSKAIYHGGPAFPSATLVHDEVVHRVGMTLRDYFAAKAMQAMLSSPNCPMQICEKELASQSYITADALLEARFK